MTQQELETRVANLEATVAELKKQIEKPATDEKPWWMKIRGSFADDPDFDEAMRLGREYRESLRPKDDAENSDDNS